MARIPRGMKQKPYRDYGTVSHAQPNKFDIGDEVLIADRWRGRITYIRHDPSGEEPPKYKVREEGSPFPKFWNESSLSLVNGGKGRQIWDGLKSNHYPVRATPYSLRVSLENRLENPKRNETAQGFWFKGRYSIPYTIVREDESSWVVSTERIGAGGISSGGHYYVSKKNPKLSVWD